jgi:hypothetical protein
MNSAQFDVAGALLDELTAEPPIADGRLPHAHARYRRGPG